MSAPPLNAGTPTQKLILWLLRLIIRLLFHLEVTGLNNIPATGPVIIIINHISFFDPLLVFGVSSRLVIPMAKKEAFDSIIWGFFLKEYGAIPVHRGEADVRAIKSTLHVLQHQGILLVAPEGTRSPTCQLQAGKQGVALIALRSGAILVPIGITGTQYIKTCWRALKRPLIRLNIGEPFQLRAFTDRRQARTELNAVTCELMYRLAIQLPPEYRGVYSDLEQASETYITPLSQLRQIP